MNDLVLTGLDGSNPLAFLAALGVLVALDERAAPAAPRPRLSWRLDGVWRPVVSSEAASIDELVVWLDEDRAQCVDEPALRFSYDKQGKEIPDVKPPPEVLHEQLRVWLRDTAPDRRRTLDWFTAFVSEGALDNNGAAKPTALHFTAGQQKFMKAVLELADGTEASSLRQVLVGPWRYDSTLPVMGWDNTETRDYALRASDPSKEKTGNPGADWLAVRGLVLLPTAARRQSQQTAGAAGGWKSGTWTWPVWTARATRTDVASLLVRPGLAGLDPARRSRLGIPQVFRTSILRSDQGGYGSVTPATVV